MTLDGIVYIQHPDNGNIALWTWIDTVSARAGAVVLSRTTKDYLAGEFNDRLAERNIAIHLEKLQETL